jgi:mRNA interferase RelE/StbE
MSSAALAWSFESYPQAENEFSKIDREGGGKIVRFLRERVAPLEDLRCLGEALKDPEFGRF